MTVFLLTIEHKHGTDHWVCLTREIAEANLDNYVQTWWEKEMEDALMPDNAEERIRQYFDQMEDSESHSIEKLPILTEATLNASLLAAKAEEGC